MNVEEAKLLKRGEILHYIGDRPCSRHTGPRGGITTDILKARVTGEPNLWKKSPGKVRVPIKHGFYNNGSINEDNCQFFHREADCPVLASLHGTTGLMVGDLVRVLNHRYPEYIGKTARILSERPTGFTIELDSSVPGSGGSDLWELKGEYLQLVESAEEPPKSTCECTRNGRECDGSCQEAEDAMLERIYGE